MAKRRRLLRWTWSDNHWGKDTGAARLLEVYVPGPDGGRMHGETVMMRIKTPKRMSIKEARQFMEERLSSLISRRFAGADPKS